MLCCNLESRMIHEYISGFEVLGGLLLTLYPLYNKPLSGRLQQLILLTVCTGCSASLARRAEPQLLWFAVAYSVITTATFFVPMLIVVAACVTTCTALLADLVPWYVSLCMSVGLALGSFASSDFVKHWQVWLLPGLAGVLVSEGICAFASISGVVVFGGVYAVGCGLQVVKLKRNFELLQKEAEEYKENHYKMFEEGSALLAACKNDQEQLERVLFGAGLY